MSFCDAGALAQSNPGASINSNRKLSNYQKTPEDKALREKFFQLAQVRKPTPSVSDQASISGKISSFFQARLALLFATAE